MCGFCGSAGVRDDAVMSLKTRGTTETQTRLRLADVAAQALEPLRVTVRSWGGRFVVTSATGRTEVVGRYAEIAGAAARVTGFRYPPERDRERLRAP